MASLNLTPLRRRALRMIQQRPGITAQRLAYELAERPNGWCGFDRAYTGAQAATRWGSSYVAPLVAAGLVRLSDEDDRGYKIMCGWKALFLTDKGRVAAFPGEGE